VALAALSFIGEPALPPLAQALSDPYQSNHPTLIIAMVEMIGRGVPKTACLPPLLNATTDYDPDVRSIATNFIFRLAPEYLTNPPPH
jgi:HEAT repeat protein